LSVSLTTNLGEPAIWKLGDHAGKRRGKPALSRADLRAETIREACELEIVHDVPPRRHALIVNWPVDELEHKKDVAIELASKATLEVRPS